MSGIAAAIHNNLATSLLLEPRRRTRIVCAACLILSACPTVVPRAAANEVSQDNESVYLPNDSYPTVMTHDTVVVSATRMPALVGEISQDVYIISGDAVRDLPARDIAEALTYTPAVDVQLNGFPGRPTSLSINGSSARHVRLLVDGIPFNTQLSGQANPAQIPVDYVGSVEIIKGPASSAWGSALGGVVNVISRPVGSAAQPQGAVTTSFAEFGTFRHSLELAGAVDTAGYFFTGSHFETDGPRPVSDVKESNGFGKISIPLADAMAITGQFGYVNSDSQYRGPTDAVISAQPYRSRFGKLQIQSEDDDLQWSAAVKFNDQDIRTDSISPMTGDTLFSTISSDWYKGISLNGKLDLDDYGSLVAGVDYEYHRLKSNNFLASSEDLTTQAPYINYSIGRRNWDVDLGLRFDHNDRFGSQVSPSLGAVYYFHDPARTSVRARVARGFNAPPLLWLYNDDPALFVGANPDLKAERAVVYEVGLKSHWQRLQFQLNLYRANVRDAIALMFDADDFVFRQRNFEEFRRQGAEILIDYRLTDQITLYTSGAFNDVENRQTGETVRDQGIARQKFTFGTRYRNTHGFSCYLLGYYNRWSSPPDLNPNDRKPIFDLRMSQAVKKEGRGPGLEVFLNVHNLTNSKYWSSESFPLAKRYFEGGMTIRF